jgi:DNA-binding response OmpR family regulator
MSSQDLVEVGGHAPISVALRAGQTSRFGPRATLGPTLRPEGAGAGGPGFTFSSPLWGMLSEMANDQGTIVVVEDDSNISDLVDLYLRREGFRVIQAGTGEAGLTAIERERPRMAILDVGLPGAVDGLEVCRRVLAKQALPILFLTARDGEVDRIVGLELGADDYVTKPFSPRELVARVKAILRRADGGSERSEVLMAGRVEVDVARREARVDGEVVALASKEFQLLQFLAERPGRALSRQQLLDGVWGTGWFGDDRTVDAHVRQLRKKLGDALPLSTVWGMGYRLG